MKICFDLETTGIKPGEDEILQVSIIDENFNTLMNEYVRPEHTTEWPEAEAVNHISPDMVKNCRTFKELAGAIQNIFLKCEELISYNGTFDIKFLTANGVYVPSVPHTDVMKEFAPIYGEKGRYGSFKWQKLVKCAEYYGYTFPAHDSLEDVKATLYCYYKMRGIEPEIEKGGALEAEVLTVENPTHTYKEWAEHYDELKNAITNPSPTGLYGFDVNNESHIDFVKNYMDKPLIRGLCMKLDISIEILSPEEMSGLTDAEFVRYTNSSIPYELIRITERVGSEKLNEKDLPEILRKDAPHVWKAVEAYMDFSVPEMSH